MHRRAFLKAGAITLGAAAGPRAFAQAARPNIVLILADDVSPDLFSCYGLPGAARTPNIDRMAVEGVLFKTCYATAMCAPSRACLMTGRYAPRTGVYQNALWLGDSNRNLFRDHLSFGKLIRGVGYRTAIAGKWHCSAIMPYEKEVGFDEYCLWESLRAIGKLPGSPKFSGAMEDPVTPSRYWQPGLIRNHELVETRPNDFGPDICCEFLCDFMARCVADKAPFLAYWPVVAPHGTRGGVTTTPLRGPVGEMGKPPTKEEHEARFKALVEYVDLLVGKVRNKVDALGIADQTVFLFCADNGTATTAKTRGVEWGCHVALVAAGAGVKRRGATEELTDFSDIAPTLIEWAGATVPPGYQFDGVSLAAFLRGDTDTHREWIYSNISTSQVVRTKTHLLEVVNPILGIPQGRFYYTGANRFGKGYERVDDDPEHAAARKQMDEILKRFPPITADHPHWQTPDGKKFLAEYTARENVERHLHNHPDYALYDER